MKPTPKQSKVTLFIFIAALMLSIAADRAMTWPSTASSLSASPAAPEGDPDLIVKEIVFEQSASMIRVRVLNQGAGPSSSCYLALQSLIGNDPSLGTKQRVWTIPIPGLAAGKGFSNVIDVSPLTQANGPWRATIDRSNTVAEANEGNNTLTYPLSNPGNPGPVPPKARRPDLIIANFELTDPVKGQVNVEVVNKGGGSNSAPCTLRLIVWKPGKFEQQEAKTVFVKVPAMHSGQSAKVMAVAGVPIINTRYSLFIDIGEAVTESNEDNNRGEGEAGNFKP